MTPHQRIRLARRHAGCSQAQLAKTVGVLRSAVSHWESPLAQNPSIKHLREVAHEPGVAAGWSRTIRAAKGLRPGANVRTSPPGTASNASGTGSMTNAEAG